LDTLKSVPEFKEAEFYLAGGSGLIFYFSHRLSIDEDFFTKKTFQPDRLFSALASHFQTRRISQAPGTLHVELNGVLCSFLHYPYPVLETNSIENIPLASVADIGCMKLSALISRGSKKDYVDLHEILTKEVVFDELWTLYKKKYNVNDDEIYAILKSMTYFADADRERLAPELEIRWNAIKKFFVTLAQHVSQSLIKR